jgi:hypothetical protein
MLKFLLLLNMLNENFTKARNKQSNLLNMLIFKISVLSLISIFGDFPDEGWARIGSLGSWGRKREE